MKFTWAEKLSPPDCHYLTRWVFETRWFSIRLHHWLSSDDSRYFHDHPWWFWSWVIKGSYIDKTENYSELRKRWSLKRYEATHRHTVVIPPEGCWTILLTGPKTRVWGFWVKGKFKKVRRYFWDYGHHQCN